MGKDNMQNEEGLDIVEFKDEDGNVYYYEEEEVIVVGDNKFAVLSKFSPEDEEHEDGCDCGCEEDSIIAKIIINEDGEEEYIAPTDEEFDAVLEAYDGLTVS